MFTLIHLFYYFFYFRIPPSGMGCMSFSSTQGKGQYKMSRLYMFIKTM